jgi:hypothetical protein
VCVPGVAQGVERDRVHGEWSREGGGVWHGGGVWQFSSGAHTLQGLGARAQTPGHRRASVTLLTHGHSLAPVSPVGGFVPQEKWSQQGVGVSSGVSHVLRVAFAQASHY